MSTTTEQNQSAANWILTALPPDDYERLAHHLEPVKLPFARTIYAPNEVIKHVYFPTTAMVSVVANTQDGLSVEIGVVGREGMTGTSSLIGDEGTSPTESMAQLGGDGLRMPAEVAREEFTRGGAFQNLLLRYMQALSVQVGRSAACNRLHTVEERLARWLLMTHDRATSDVLALTQEFIAMMLGCRRAGVTSAAITLQGDGLIRYARGNITILDREGLENFTCECYGVVRAEYDRLLKQKFSTRGSN